VIVQTGLFYILVRSTPHVGHRALLNHAFANSQDINVIAAIVLLLDDDSVRAKCRALGQTLVFSKNQRVRLRRGYGWHDWCWIYDGSTSEWPSLRRRLTEAAAHDGFDIKFVALTGPDHVSLRKPLVWNPWDCKQIIVSDVFRSADFTTSVGTLRPFEECDSWKQVCWDEDIAVRQATRTAAFLGGGLSLLSPAVLNEILEEDQLLHELPKLLSH
jgi:hypothetical protein